MLSMRHNANAAAAAYVAAYTQSTSNINGGGWLDANQEWFDAADSLSKAGSGNLVTALVQAIAAISELQSDLKYSTFTRAQFEMTLNKVFGLLYGTVGSLEAATGVTARDLGLQGELVGLNPAPIEEDPVHALCDRVEELRGDSEAGDIPRRNWDAYYEALKLVRRARPVTIDAAKRVVRIMERDAADEAFMAEELSKVPEHLPLDHVEPPEPLGPVDDDMGS